MFYCTYFYSVFHQHIIGAVHGAARGAVLLRLFGQLYPKAVPRGVHLAALAVAKLHRGNVRLALHRIGRAGQALPLQQQGLRLALRKKRVFPQRLAQLRRLVKNGAALPGGKAQPPAACKRQLLRQRGRRVPHGVRQTQRAVEGIVCLHGGLRGLHAQRRAILVCQLLHGRGIRLHIAAIQRRIKAPGQLYAHTAAARRRYHSAVRAHGRCPAWRKVIFQLGLFFGRRLGRVLLRGHQPCLFKPFQRGLPLFLGGRNLHAFHRKAQRLCRLAGHGAKLFLRVCARAGNVCRARVPVHRQRVWHLFALPGPGRGQKLAFALHHHGLHAKARAARLLQRKAGQCAAFGRRAGPGARAFLLRGGRAAALQAILRLLCSPAGKAAPGHGGAQHGRGQKRSARRRGKPRAKTHGRPPFHRLCGGGHGVLQHGLVHFANGAKQCFCPHTSTPCCCK